jgi:hypothetical protein
MASVSGGLFHPTPASTTVAPGPRPEAGPLSLAAVTDAQTTAGGGTGSGLGDPRFSGSLPAPAEQVVSTTTGEGGTVIHLPDGSTITLVGVTQIASFIH